MASFCKIGQGKGQYNLFAMVCWFLPSSGVSQLYGYAHIPSLLNVPRPHRTPRVITGAQPASLRSGSFPPALCPTRGGVSVSKPLTIHSTLLSPPPPPRVHRSILSICVWNIPALVTGPPPTPGGLGSVCHLLPDLQGLGFRGTPSFFHLKFLSHQHSISLLKPKSVLTHPLFHLAGTLFSKALRPMCL